MSKQSDLVVISQDGVNPYDSDTTSTGFFALPSGTTAQRPASPVLGIMRFNTTLGSPEVYDSVGWTLVESPPSISSLTYADSTTAAEPAGGQTITLNGERFDSNASVYIDGSAVGSVTYNSQSSLSIITPAKSAGSYTIEVTNPSGISSRSTIEYSNNPSWVNAVDTIITEVSQGAAFSVTTNTASEGSDTISYSEVTTVLTGTGAGEMGATLNSSTGEISGTAPSVAADTIFTFTLRATDEEGQSTDRQFKIRVRVNFFGDGSDGDLST